MLPSSYTYIYTCILYSLSSYFLFLKMDPVKQTKGGEGTRAGKSSPIYILCYLYRTYYYLFFLQILHAQQKLEKAIKDPLNSMKPSKKCQKRKLLPLFLDTQNTCAFSGSTHHSAGCTESRGSSRTLIGFQSESS